MEIIKRTREDQTVLIPLSAERFQKRLAFKSKAPHERAELINEFVENINRRTSLPYKPVTYKQVNGQVRMLPTPMLYGLMKECKEGRNFGALFWYKVKQLRLSTTKS